MGLKRDLVNDETAKSVEAEAIKVAKNLNAEYWSVSGKLSTLTKCIGNSASTTCVLYFSIDLLFKAKLNTDNLAADNFNIDELFSRIACLTFDNILAREDKMQSEKKVISPVKPSVPRKITLDDDFRKKTRDEQQNSCAFNSKCA